MRGRGVACKVVVEHKEAMMMDRRSEARLIMLDNPPAWPNVLLLYLDLDQFDPL